MPRRVEAVQCRAGTSMQGIGASAWCRGCSSGVILLFWPFPVIPPSSPVLPSSFFLSSTLGSLCFGVKAAAQRGKEPRGD